MESPVARIFGIDCSSVSILIGYTCTDNSEPSLPDFFGEKSSNPMTIPMDRSRLLTKLRPSKTLESKYSSQSSSLENTSPRQRKSSDPTNRPSLESDTGRVDIRLEDFASMMIDATSTNRTWVKDFSDDQIAISRDLYEVMLAYQRMRRAG